MFLHHRLGPNAKFQIERAQHREVHPPTLQQFSPPSDCALTNTAASDVPDAEATHYICACGGMIRVGVDEKGMGMCRNMECGARLRLGIWASLDEQLQTTHLSC